jgi:2,3-bisphosphoglycerate-dependent phosphoglycerate mutase
LGSFFVLIFKEQGTMQLYFVRHAQSTNNALWDRTGASVGRSEDPELTETGVVQAGLVAQFILASREYSIAQNAKTGKPTEFNITHLYASPMVRALDTAMEISKRVGILPVLFKDLHEAGGIYLGGDVDDEPRVGLAGKNANYFREKYPELALPAWIGDAGWYNRPYETREERLPRAKRVLVELLARHGNSDDQVMLVSHGAFYNYFMRALLELSVDLPCSFVIYNTAITRVDFWEDEFQLVYLNRADHLPPDKLT